MKTVILFILAIFYSINLFPQYRFQHLGITDGLSQTSVHCIFQDSNGFMWFGTQDGLNRYDGYSFKMFHHNMKDTTTISDDFILKIAEDKNKNLWIGTRNGLNFFNKKTEKFIRIFSPDMDKNYFHNSVSSLFSDSDGNIFFLSPQNINTILIDSISANFQIQSFPFNFSQNSVFCFDKNKSFFIADSTGIYGLKYVNNTLFNRELITDKIKIKNYLNSGIYFDKKNKLWIFSSDQIKVWDIEKKSFRSASLPIESFRCIDEDNEGNIWMGNLNGLYTISQKNLKISVLKNFPGDVESLSSNSVIYIYTNNSGLIWIGTSDDGINIFNPLQQVFKLLKNQNGTANELTDNSIWSMFQDNNKLFVGTGSGLNIFTIRSEKFSDYKTVEQNIIYKLKFKSKKNVLSSAAVRAIAKDKDGQYWIGSKNGIAIIDEQGKIRRTLTSDNSSLSNNNIFHLLCAKDGSIWISTSNGLNHYLSHEKKMEVFKNFITDKNNNPVNYFLNTYEDRYGQLWICSAYGISIFNPATNEFQNFSSSYDDKNSLSYNITSSVLEDSKKRIWVSTLGGGLNLFDRNKKAFTNFTTKDGLPNNTVYGILEGANGILWVATNNGISSFNPETKNFTNYNVNDGIVSNEFSQNSFFKNKNGELFFGSTDGMLIFNSKEIIQHKISPVIRLIGISINYNQLVPFEIAENKIVNLYHNDKTLSFEFAELYFINPDKIMYSYKLEGFNDEWVETNSGQRIATYTNLPFGNYTFRVRSKKNNNEWSESGLNISVHVIPPFWMTWWFIVFEIFSGFVILVFIVIYFSQKKLRKKIQKIEMQRKIQSERERISRDLHDNVGSHLTYIVTSLDNISHNIYKREKIISQKKISSLSDFSRETIQQLRETIWAINKESITLADFKNKVNEHLLKILPAENNINFNIELAVDENRKLNPSVAIHLFRIVQEAVNNSIKHSHAENISLAISESTKNNLSIRIADDGNGFKEDIDLEGHYGLENMKERVKEIGGEINIISDSGSGVKLFIFIPY